MPYSRLCSAGHFHTLRYSLVLSLATFQINMSLSRALLRSRPILSLVNNNVDRATCCLLVQKKWESTSVKDILQPSYLRQQYLKSSTVITRYLSFVIMRFVCWVSNSPLPVDSGLYCNKQQSISYVGLMQSGRDRRLSAIRFPLKRRSHHNPKT